MELTTPRVIALVIEGLILAAGLGFLWRRRYWKELTSDGTASPLAPWKGELLDIGTFLFFAIATSIFMQLFCLGLFDWRVSHASAAARTVVAACGFQGGLILGCFAYMHFVPAGQTISRPKPGFLVEGAVTFTLSLPLVFGTALLWGGLLNLFGVEPQLQEMIDLFKNAKSPLLVGIMVTVAVVCAPLSEELVFRAGIFRYLRSRPGWFSLLLPGLVVGSLTLVLLGVVRATQGSLYQGLVMAASGLALLGLAALVSKLPRVGRFLVQPIPRWVVLLLPAVLFAALHANLASFPQLTVLGVLFALSYERTGNIAVPMLAHGLFNLNTMLLLLAGIDA